MLPKTPFLLRPVWSDHPLGALFSAGAKSTVTQLKATCPMIKTNDGGRSLTWRIRSIGTPLSFLHRSSLHGSISVELNLKGFLYHALLDIEYIYETQKTMIWYLSPSSNRLTLGQQQQQQKQRETKFDSLLGDKWGDSMSSLLSCSPTWPTITKLNPVSSTRADSGILTNGLIVMKGQCRPFFFDIFYRKRFQSILISLVLKFSGASVK